MSLCLHTGLLKLIHTGIEDIELSSEERSYYMERFDQSVVAFDQLEMAETVGEGIRQETWSWVYALFSYYEG